MQFQFDSLASFMAMNGHGQYVWAAYGISFAVLIYLLLSPRLQRRQFIRAQVKSQRVAQK